MRQFVVRFGEFQARGVDIVRVFYSPLHALKLALGDDPPPYPVLADPKRLTYDRFGVEKSVLGLLKASAFKRVRESKVEKLRPHWRDAIRDGFTGLPADFLIGTDGKILRAHYGKDFTDSTPPTMALEWCRNLGIGEKPPVGDCSPDRSSRG